MKLTNTPTDYIIIKAVNNSDWDTVDFIILPVSNKEWNDKILFCMKTAEEVAAKTENFEHIAIDEDHPDWFTKPDEMEENDKFVDFFQNDEKIWSFIDIEENEIDKLPRPQQNLRYGTLKIAQTGFQYVICGKHTGEEFWIPFLQYKEIVEQYNQSKQLQTS